MIKFIWRYLFGEMYNTPKLSATDIIELHESKLITFTEARYNLGFDWYDSDENVYGNFYQVRDHQQGGKAIL